MPKAMIESEVKSKIDWAVKWLKDLKVKKPELLAKYTQKKQYLDGQSWAIAGHDFILRIQEIQSSSGKINIKGSEIFISIPNSEDYDKQKLIKNLLIKICQKVFKPYLIRRVEFYNHRYFHKEINDVKLKYNSSNWGSCSIGKNLNFSIRLLFAPEWVIDYVVIHELAHLVEMNHSDKFWRIVASIMPDYRSAEKHLKEFGSQYDF
jgi:hypothetical protein